MALNNKRIAGSIFFDLKEAFDCVNRHSVSKDGILWYKGCDVYINQILLRGQIPEGEI